MTRRPLHVGRPPSFCGRATLRSAWVPEEDADQADCKACDPPGPAPYTSSDAPIAKWRVAAGLMQIEVSEVARMSRPSWSYIERGFTPMRLDVFARVVSRWPDAEEPILNAVRLAMGEAELPHE